MIRLAYFCEELETVNHLLFECCIAMLTWMNISEITGVAAGPRL
jgi:hypothetical protein